MQVGIPPELTWMLPVGHLIGAQAPPTTIKPSRQGGFGATHGA